MSSQKTHSTGTEDALSSPDSGAAEDAAPAGLRKTSLVKTAVNTYLEEGMTDKRALYTKVAAELGVPRPSVRRIVHDMRLRDELLDKVNVLRPAAEAQAAARPPE